MAPVVAYWTGRWTDADLQLVEARRGDPAGRARLEALTLWMSIVKWEPVLRQAQGKLLVIGDALGVLHDAVRLKARDPILNLIMSEKALVIAPSGGDICAARLWTERNSDCDELSRHQPWATPTAGALHNAQRLSMPRLNPRSCIETDC